MPPVVSRGRPSRSTSTTGCAQHIPLQPAATTRKGSPRRSVSARSASKVAAAPTASPQVPSPTASRAPVRRRSASRLRAVKRAPGEPADTLVGGPPNPVVVTAGWVVAPATSASTSRVLTRP